MKTPKSIIWRYHTQHERDGLFLGFSGLAVIIFSGLGLIICFRQNPPSFEAIAITSVFYLVMPLWITIEIINTIRQIRTARQQNDPLESLSLAELQQLLSDVRQDEETYNTIKSQLRTKLQCLQDDYYQQRNAILEELSEHESSFNAQTARKKIKLYTDLIRTKTDA